MSHGPHWPPPRWGAQQGLPGEEGQGEPQWEHHPGGGQPSPWQAPAGSQPPSAESAASPGDGQGPPATWGGQPPGRAAPQPPIQPDPGARRGRRVPLLVTVLLIVIALLAGLVLGALGGRSLFSTSPSLPTTSGGGSQGVSRPPDSVAGIAEDALSSTVFIRTISGSETPTGSGLVVREDGYLVTNNHVVAAAAAHGGQMRVVFGDGSEEEAELVGRTPAYDLAVLEVDREDLTPLTLADSDNLVVGDQVVAVGAPLGLEGTVTTGIISALNRPVNASEGGGDSFINAIQTDAAINPGNSGGPLLNADGEVVGINTAIAQSGQQSGSIGLGFAIPADQVRRTVEQLIDTGEATYPVIGVGLDTRYNDEGIQVLEDAQGDTDPVTPGGPGDEAGVEAGDIILSFDGQPMTTADELIVAVRSEAPGETVPMTVRRDGEEIELELELGEEVDELDGS